MQRISSLCRFFDSLLFASPSLHGSPFRWIPGVRGLGSNDNPTAFGNVAVSSRCPKSNTALGRLLDKAKGKKKGEKPLRNPFSMSSRHGRDENVSVTSTQREVETVNGTRLLRQSRHFVAFRFPPANRGQLSSPADNQWSFGLSATVIGGTGSRRRFDWSNFNFLFVPSARAVCSSFYTMEIRRETSEKKCCVKNVFFVHINTCTATNRL